MKAVVEEGVGQKTTSLQIGCRASSGCGRHGHQRELGLGGQRLLVSVGALHPPEPPEPLLTAAWCPQPSFRVSAEDLLTAASCSCCPCSWRLMFQDWRGCRWAKRKPGLERMCCSGPRGKFWTFCPIQRFSNCGLWPLSECEISLVGQDQCF